PGRLRRRDGRSRPRPGQAGSEEHRPARRQRRQRGRLGVRHGDQSGHALRPVRIEGGAADALQARGRGSDPGPGGGGVGRPGRRGADCGNERAREQRGSEMSASSEVRRLTTSDIGRMYADNERIPMLTAYDYPTARILDEAGIPMILVGDSLGQVMLGYETTVKVTMAEMLHHTRAVVRGTRRALVIGDMPFLTYSTIDEATDNAGRFMQDAGAQAVKIEGGVRSARIVEAL